MGAKMFQVDSFTDKPFAGNPAGVCMLALPRGNDWMQDVAAEMNVSETAFLLPDDGGWLLRWFTPKVEVNLCGHATLASAHALWEAEYLRADGQARFHTKSGLLTAQRRGDWIEMDFPFQPLGAELPTDGLEAMLGVPAVTAYEAGWTRLVELASEQDVRAARPDFATMKAGPWGTVIITAPSESTEFDFVSRFFAPAVGIDEDPVTGSAHCVLGPYWAERLGKDELLAYQASWRGGVVRVRPAGDRVKLAGQAVTTLKGELT